MGRQRISNKGFTLIEVVIVIAVIAMVSAILIPNLIETYNNQKNNIINIYNGAHVVCMCGTEVLYEGEQNNIPSDLQQDYTLSDIAYQGGVVYMYFQPKESDKNED